MNDTKELLKNYVARFNADDEENVIQAIPNSEAASWMLAQVPRISLPDAEIERTYYFRWWTYRKHIKATPEGYVMSEFHPDVEWAGRYNTIPCAVNHHVREGRWLRDSSFLDDYIRFWYSDGGVHLRDYSNTLEAQILTLSEMRGDDTGNDLLPQMIANYNTWRRERITGTGLYWSNDDRDGSEFSVTGPGVRTTLNCFMYAGARAIAAIAARMGETSVAEEFEAEAERIRGLINELLWDEERRFYMPIHQQSPEDEPYAAEVRDARELFGYLPWTYGIAPGGRSDAFRQLFDREGFAGRFGLMTCERRGPGFGLFYTADELLRWCRWHGSAPCGPNGHECLWNGPVWPFATSYTLMAVAELLTGGEAQENVTVEDYASLLHTYAASHRRITADGREICWIDEDQNPDTGDWISRTVLMNFGGEYFPQYKGGYERGKDYNHSTFCDLVLGGLFGIRPGMDTLAISPLIPESWDHALVEGVRVHGKELSISYTTGEGYFVTLDREVRFRAEKPEPCVLTYM